MPASDAYSAGTRLPRSPAMSAPLAPDRSYHSSYHSSYQILTEWSGIASSSKMR